MRAVQQFQLAFSWNFCAALSSKTSSRNLQKFQKSTNPYKSSKNLKIATKVAKKLWRGFELYWRSCKVYKDCFGYFKHNSKDICMQTNCEQPMTNWKIPRLRSQISPDKQTYLQCAAESHLLVDYTIVGLWKSTHSTPRHVHFCPFKYQPLPSLPRISKLPHPTANRSFPSVTMTECLKQCRILPILRMTFFNERRICLEFNLQKKI
jgi:hypothetical protein